MNSENVDVNGGLPVQKVGDNDVGRAVGEMLKYDVEARVSRGKPLLYQGGKDLIALYADLLEILMALRHIIATRDDEFRVVKRSKEHRKLYMRAYQREYREKLKKKRKEKKFQEYLRKRAAASSSSIKDASCASGASGDTSEAERDSGSNGDDGFLDV